MALHPNFPRSPYEVLPPDLRWFPAAEELRSTAYEKLLPPLVATVREEVKTWRDAGYAGASATSRSLLAWWFATGHLIEQVDGTQSQFRYYFAQREAVETVIWLYDVRGARDKFDLMRFDASGAVSANMFDEAWPRFVVKMATGAGKTKVLSLLIAWSYFHKLYEADSTLACNFLLIAPNIIVLDRLRADFDGLRIFFNDPVLPDNGHVGHNWRDDFQVALHIQDDVRIVRPTGNLFLTNIHRVYLGEVTEPSLEDDDLRDYFLAPFGAKPVGKATDSNTDLGEIVREIDELAVFNDEAHHIHDSRLAWFQCIQDIHHQLLQKDLHLAIQVDVTATPRHDNGAIFVQTVSDYPLVDAIAQNVVKHPVLPDAASRAKLADRQSPIISEKYAEAAIAVMKEGKSEVMCEQGQLYKVSKNKEGIVTKARLTKQWTDWVDYWAVDFDYMSRKEIIKVPVGTGLSGVASLPGFEAPQGEMALPQFEERWTCGYIFENEWQSFRTRQNRELELATAVHTYDRPGRYTVAVKVIDIFGNDTMTLVPVNVG